MGHRIRPVFEHLVQRNTTVPQWKWCTTVLREPLHLSQLTKRRSPHRTHGITLRDIFRFEIGEHRRTNEIGDDSDVRSIMGDDRKLSSSSSLDPISVELETALLETLSSSK